MTHSFGVAVTTLDRRATFIEAFRNLVRHTPSDVPLVVVDDGSTLPVNLVELPDSNVVVHRHAKPLGIARAKNKCIKLLMETGVQHLFLLDDDVWPTEKWWWEPYLNSGRPHLIYQPNTHGIRCRTCRNVTWHVYDTLAGRMACTICEEQVKPLYADDRMFCPKWAAGVVLYMTRATVEAVGGMRPEFGRWSCETWEYSYRIHNTLRTQAFPFNALRDSSFHSVDAVTTGKRSCLDWDTRDDHRARNWDLFCHFKDSTGYVSYEEDRPMIPATVCIPWRTAPDRVAAFRRCRKFWNDNGFKVVTADSDPDNAFLCGQARNNAARKARTEVIIIADGDTLPHHIDQVHEAVGLVEANRDCVVWPFTVYKHLPANAIGVPHAQLGGIEAVKTYTHGSPGGIIVMHAETLWKLGGFDERFEPGGWGFDDTAFQLAARTLAEEIRLAGTVYSFDHAVDSSGTPGRDLTDANPNKVRYKLYEMCSGKPDLMRALIR